MEQVNSPIDFIAPSGGNIIDCHSLRFLPTLETPTLPSGSIWMKPNDGQLERFLYQGTSGIFEIRDTEGHGSYTIRGDDTTDISIGATPTLLELGPEGAESVDRLDRYIYYQEDDFVTSSWVIGGTTQFTVKVSGLYKIAYSMPFHNTTGGGNNDGVLESSMQLDGTNMSGSVVRQYLWLTGGGQRTCTMSAEFFAILLPYQTMELTVRLYNGNVSTILQREGGTVIFELIEPLIE